MRRSRMVMFADDLGEWKDFPKGLRVLVLDEDLQAAAETKSKLEGFEYVVFTFANEEDALAALASQTNLFHVALVEVTTGNGCGGFRFLETACDLPTIMMSKMSCLNTMMKCLALGAAEFLQKPISEDKLKNIWQHVVHKAFSACEMVLSDSLKPVKATIASMLQFALDQAQVKKDLQGADPSSGSIHVASASHKVQDYSSVPTHSGKQEANIEHCNSEKFPAPSTPQLEQGGRSTSDEDVHDKALKLEYSTKLRTETWDAGNTFEWGATGEVKLDVEATSNWSSHVDSLISVQEETQDLEQVSSKTRDTGQSELKSADIKRGQFGHGLASSAAELQPRLKTVNVDAVDDSSVAEEDLSSAGGSKSEEENVEKETVASSHFYNEDNVDSSTEDIKGKKGNPDPGCEERKNASGKKKMKVDWTAELHRRFVQAVEQLGVDQAIPSKILELMKVDGLTRHNVASHLQKYRSHRRHTMSREDESTKRQSWKHIGTMWTRTKQDGPWSHRDNPAYPPVLGFPPTQQHPSPHGPPVGSSLHVWGHPTVDQSGRHMWQQPPMGTPTTWQAPDGFLWKHPGMCVDGWGCPLPGTPFFTQPMMRIHTSHASAAIPDPKMPITAANGSIRQVSHPDPASNAGSTLWGNFIDVHPPKELIDEAIKEALNNPWAPLPLGLKPPSIESVMAELQTQGISKIPPSAS